MGKRKRSQHLGVFSYTTYFATARVYTKFEELNDFYEKQKNDFLRAVVSEKSLTKIIGEKEKNGQIRGMINVRIVILSYTIQVVVPNACTKF